MTLATLSEEESAADERARPDRFRRFDYLLIVGVVLAPIDSVVPNAPASPGELLVILWSAVALVRYGRKTPLSIHGIFWMVWLTIVVVGTWIGLSTPNSGTKVDGLATWLVIAFVAISVYTSMSARSLDVVKQILSRMAIVGAGFYSFLYAWGELVSPMFFGMHLYYGGLRFAGGASNPHLLATLLAPVVMVCFLGAFTTQKMSSRLGYLVLGAGSLLAALATQSSTLIVAFVLSIVLTAVLYLVGSQVEEGAQVALAVLSLAVTAFILLVMRDVILERITGFITSDSNGLGRLEIFSSVGSALELSPVFGLGPGTHGLGGVIELHNSYLEILAMSGALGFLVFLAYLIPVIWRLSRNTVLLAIALPLLFYGVGGFSFRRLPFWVFLMILVSIADRQPKAGQKAFGKVEVRDVIVDEPDRGSVRAVH